jgi:hypothetical protein
MTTNFGRITALQGAMLKLAGCQVTRAGGDARVSDDDAVVEMLESLARLRRHTNLDLGFDLRGWHEVLLASPEWSREYTHSYGWDSVRPAVEEAILSVTYRRRAALAQLPRGEAFPSPLLSLKWTGRAEVCKRLFEIWDVLDRDGSTSAIRQERTRVAHCLLALTRSPDQERIRVVAGRSATDFPVRAEALKQLVDLPDSEDPLDRQAVATLALGALADVRTQDLWYQEDHAVFRSALRLALRTASREAVEVELRECPSQILKDLMTGLCFHGIAPTDVALVHLVGGQCIAHRVDTQVPIRAWVQFERLLPDGLERLSKRLERPRTLLGGARADLVERLDDGERERLLNFAPNLKAQFVDRWLLSNEHLEAILGAAPLLARLQEQLSTGQNLEAVTRVLATWAPARAWAVDALKDERLAFDTRATLACALMLAERPAVFQWTVDSTRSGRTKDIELAIFALLRAPKVEERDFYFELLRRSTNQWMLTALLDALVSLNESGPDWAAILKEVARFGEPLDTDQRGRFRALQVLAQDGDDAAARDLVVVATSNSRLVMRNLAMKYLAGLSIERSTPLIRQVLDSREHSKEDKQETARRLLTSNPTSELMTLALRRGDADGLRAGLMALEKKASAVG